MYNGICVGMCMRTLHCYPLLSFIIYESYIYIYIYIYIYVYVCMCVCMWVYVCVYVYNCIRYI